MQDQETSLFGQMNLTKLIWLNWPGLKICLEQLAWD